MVSITLHTDSAVLFTYIGEKEHSKVVTAEISGLARDEAEIVLLTAALERFNKPSEITVYSGPYVYGVLKNRWIERWAESGWVNSKGKPVRYKEQWQQAYEYLKIHNYTAELKGR